MDAFIAFRDTFGIPLLTIFALASLAQYIKIRRREPEFLAGIDRINREV